MQQATKGKIRVGILVVLFAAVILAFLALMFFFLYTGIFGLLGIRYDSWRSVAVFLLLALVFDTIMGFVQLLPRLLGADAFGGMPPSQAAFLLALFQITLDFVSISTIDELMGSVSIPFDAEVALVLLLFGVNWLLRRSGGRNSNQS